MAADGGVDVVQMNQRTIGDLLCSGECFAEAGALHLGLGSREVSPNIFTNKRNSERNGPKERATNGLLGVRLPRAEIQTLSATKRLEIVLALLKARIRTSHVEWYDNYDKDPRSLNLFGTHTLSLDLC